MSPAALSANLPAVNNTTIVIAVLVLGGLYGLIAGKQRLRLLILSVYVGVVLAEQFARVAAPSLHMLSADEVSWGLFALPIVLFGFFGVVHKKGHAKGAAIANILVGLLTGALIVASAINLLPTAERAGVTGSSFLALNLEQFHLYILGGLPLVVIIMGLFKGKEKHH